MINGDNIILYETPLHYNKCVMHMAIYTKYEFCKSFFADEIGVKIKERKTWPIKRICDKL